MRVEVDQPRCMTSGQCVMIAPEVFDQDDQGVVMLLKVNPDPGMREVVTEAAAICPAAVIRLLED